MRLRWTAAQEASLMRPDGYLMELLSLGTLDGEWLELPEEDAARLREKYRPMGTPEKPVGVPIPTKPGASTQARCKTCPQGSDAARNSTLNVNLN